MSRESNNYPPVSYQSSARPNQPTLAPIAPYIRPATEMATLPPPQPHMDPYRSHGGYTIYPPSQGSIPYQQQQQAAANAANPNYPQQPAPRQRTAIACRYCRRRKIRCHGFDSSPDGRCTNCLRFHQECVFTPVSAQAHAFVPAHTAYPFMRNARVQTGSDGRPLGYPTGPQLFSAHGQPLGPIGHPDSNYASSPQSPYGPGPYGAAPLMPSSQAQFEDRQGQPQDIRPAQRRESYDYPDPSSHVLPTSPATSSTSYQGTAFGTPSTSQSFYSTPGEQRTSPTASYFGQRSTGSPHNSNVLPPIPAGLHPPQSLPTTYDSARNPSPSTSAPRTGGLSVADMLSTSSGTRSSTDSDMLNALNRHRR